MSRITYCILLMTSCCFSEDIFIGILKKVCFRGIFPAAHWWSFKPDPFSMHTKL